jgi:hypothetical protein
MRNVIDPTKWNHEPEFFKRRALREAEEDRFFSSFPNVPRGGVTSYGDWLLQQHRAGLSTDVNPPSGVEHIDAWRTRMTGLPSESLSSTGDASFGVYRGSGNERAQRIATMRSFQTSTTWESGPTQPKSKSFAERARDYILKIMPQMV